MTDSLLYVGDGLPQQEGESSANEGYANMPATLGERTHQVLGDLTGRLTRGAQEYGWNPNEDLSKWGGLIKAPSSPVIDAKTANERYAPRDAEGKTEDLFKEPVYEHVAELRGLSRARQIERESVLASYDQNHSWLTRNVVGLGDMLLDPLSAATMLTPGFGEAAIASKLGWAGLEGVAARATAREAAAGYGALAEKAAESGAEGAYASLQGLANQATRAGAAGFGERTALRLAESASGATTSMMPLIAAQYGLSQYDLQDYGWREGLSDLFGAATLGAIIHAGVVPAAKAGSHWFYEHGTGQKWTPTAPDWWKKNFDEMDHEDVTHLADHLGLPETASKSHVLDIYYQSLKNSGKLLDRGEGVDPHVLAQSEYYMSSPAIVRHAAQKAATAQVLDGRPVDLGAIMPDPGPEARKIAPDLFKEYDAHLAERRELESSLGVGPAQGRPEQGEQTPPPVPTTPAPREGFTEAATVLPPEARPAFEEAVEKEIAKDAEEFVNAPPAEEFKPAPAPTERPNPFERISGVKDQREPKVVGGFTTSKGSTYQLHEDGTTTRNKSSHVDVGHEASDVGLKPRSVKTIYIDNNMAGALSSAGITAPEGTQWRVILKDGKATLVSRDPNKPWGTTASSRDIPFSTEPGIGKQPLELWRPKNDVTGYEAYAGMHAGNVIVSIERGAKLEAKPELGQGVPEYESITALLPKDAKGEVDGERLSEYLLKHYQTEDWDGLSADEKIKVYKKFKEEHDKAARKPQEEPQAAEEAKPTPTPPKAKAPVARPPVSLIQFLRENGGLKPDPQYNEDVTNIVGLIRPNGMDADTARKALLGAQYFREDPNAPPTTSVSDFINLLHEAAGGKRIVPEHAAADEQARIEKEQAKVERARLEEQAISHLEEAGYTREEYNLFSKAEKIELQDRVARGENAGDVFEELVVRYYNDAPDEAKVPDHYIPGFDHEAEAPPAPASGPEPTQPSPEGERPAEEAEHPEQGGPVRRPGESGGEEAAERPGPAGNAPGEPAGESGATPGAEPHPAPTPEPVAPHEAFISAVKDKLLAGERPFRTIVEARKLAKEHGLEFPEGESANKHVDELVERAVVGAAREIAARGEPPADTYAKLVALYDNQPNLATRTSTSVAEQAYSTPVPLAYVASRLAGIGRETHVLEPTAGNGMLLIEANPKNARVNELNKTRAKSLKEQGYKTTTDDAAEDDAFKDRAGQMDVVIANPPFGTVKEGGKSVVYKIDGYNTTQIDHAISLNALKAMKADGRAVLIIGGVKAESAAERAEGYGQKTKRRFFYQLFNNYKVADIFTVSGDLYAKQGAGWPVDVIVIEGRGKTEREHLTKEPPPLLKSWDEVGAKLNEAPSRPIRTETRPHGEDSRPGRPPVEGGGQPGIGDEVGGAGAPGREPVQLPAPPEGPGGVGGQGAGPEPGPHGPESPVDQGTRVPPREGGDVREPDLESHPNGGGSVEEPEAPASPPPPKQKPSASEAKGGQTPYEPASQQGKPLNTLIPANLRDATAESLERLQQEHGSIDNYVASALGRKPEELGKYFSSEQVDAIGLAISNLDKGDALVVGDQTGVGKGRIAAAMISYARRNNLIPIFVTKDPGLYADMWRDLHNIGWHEQLGRPIDMMMTNVGERIPLNGEALDWTLERDEAKAEGRPKPPERGDFSRAQSAAKATENMNAVLNGTKTPDVIFTTYDQMNSVRGAETARRDFLRAVAPRAFLIMDESHRAGGGAGGDEAWRQSDKAPPRSEVFREVVGSAHSVMYASATFAKSPSVMTLYSRTDMVKAVEDPKQLPELITRGGVPLQQVVSSMLAKAGQYVRRERSFDGVDYDHENVPVSEEAYGEFTTGLRSVFDFDDSFDVERRRLARRIAAEHGGGTGNDTGVGNVSAKSTSFSSIMHNVINQMIVAMKAEQAGKRAVEAIKAGEKPVLALSKTNASFIQDFTKAAGLTVGDTVNISFADILRRYLERTRRITVKLGNDEKIHVMIPLKDMSSAARAKYRAAEDILRDIDVGDLPVSPIDAIRNVITKAGYTVREVTGRDEMLDYSGDQPVIVKRPASEMDTTGKALSLKHFNNGQLDALILNQSGSTGLSLHASEDFDDQRRRRMIIVEADPNIDTHFQMLGRVHRTGQVIAPAYTHLSADIPAEVRPTAVLMRKMASLNANTTGAAKSRFSSDAVDFMNKYGDQIVKAAMQEDLETWHRLGEPISLDEDASPAGAAAAVTGKLTLLEPKEQQALLDRISSEYKALIEHLDATGTNDLEAKHLDLQARTLASTELKAAKGPSPFQAPVNLEKVSIKSQGRAMAPNEVAERVAETLKMQQGGRDFVRDLPELQRTGRAKQNELMARIKDEAATQARAAIAAAKTDVAKMDAKIKAQQAWAEWSQLASELIPGSTKTLHLGGFGGEATPAVVLGFEQKKGAKSPVALSSWEALFALPDSNRTMGMRLSQIEMGEPIPDAMRKSPAKGANLTQGKISLPDLAAKFEQARKEGREERYMVTGNLLGGFDQTSGKGQIITHTMEDGSTRPAILMARGFKAKEFMDTRAVRFESGAHIMKFLDEPRPNAKPGDLPTVGSTDNAILIMKKNGHYEFNVPSKEKKYYTDRVVRAIFDNWERGGSMMRATIRDAEHAEQLIDALRGVGAVFETRAEQDLANSTRPEGKPTEPPKPLPPPQPEKAPTPPAPEKSAPPQWAQDHAKDLGGDVVWHEGDLALVRGFSVLNGMPNYHGVKEGKGRTSVDIKSYTGPVFTPDERAKLRVAREEVVQADEAAHQKNPNGPFGEERFAASPSVPKELAGYSQEMLGMLGIKARVYLTTLEDARANRFNGPFAAISSAGIGGGENGSMRRLSNGDYYVAVNLNSRMSKNIEVVAHEMGHILEKEEWAKVDEATKSAVMADFEAWRKTALAGTKREAIESLRPHTTGKQTTVGAGPAKELSPYWTSFGEWFADNVAKWAVSSEKPLTLVDKFFSRLGQALRNFYSNLVGRKYLPAKSVKEWLDQRGATEWAPSREDEFGHFQFGEREPNDAASLAQYEASHSLQTAEMAREDRIKEEGWTHPLTGRKPSDANLLIRAAIEGEDPRYHFNTQFMRAVKNLNLITPQEWARLENEARARGWVETARVRQEAGEAPFWAQHEEPVLAAIAEQYHDWVRGQDVKGDVAPGLFQRIRDFLARLKNWFQGNGFGTSEDVFRAIQQGEMRRRFEEPIRGRIQEINQKIWDLNPQIQDAYRQAAQRVQGPRLSELAAQQRELYKQGFTPGVTQDQLRQNQEEIYGRTEAAGEEGKPLENKEVSSGPPNAAAAKESAPSEPGKMHDAALEEAEWHLAQLSPEARALSGEELEAAARGLDDAMLKEQAYAQAMQCLFEGGF